MFPESYQILTMSSLMSEPDIMFKKYVPIHLLNSINTYSPKSDPRTSTKTLFYQSGLHPDEFGDVGGYDTKEARKYELFGKYFTEQDSNADTGWTSGLNVGNHWIMLWDIQILMERSYAISYP